MSKENVRIEIAQEEAVAQMTIYCQTEAMALKMAKFLEQIAMVVHKESDRSSDNSPT